MITKTQFHEFVVEVDKMKRVFGTVYIKSANHTYRVSSVDTITDLIRCNKSGVGSIVFMYPNSFLTVKSYRELKTRAYLPNDINMGMLEKYKNAK